MALPLLGVPTLLGLGPDARGAIVELKFKRKNSKLRSLRHDLSGKNIRVFSTI